MFSVFEALEVVLQESVKALHWVNEVLSSGCLSRDDFNLRYCEWEHKNEAQAAGLYAVPDNCLFLYNDLD